jgi:UDP-N-acetylmuramoylalanine--D-glutamate ligase
MELVTQINGIDFINDSKSTTPDACIWALKNIFKPVILIAGGKDKGADFSKIRDLVRSKVKALVLIGQDKNKIKQALKEYVFIKEEATLRDAVVTAYNMAKEGDCVLLSPMCASFDMFRDYEERGRSFKQIVRRLKPGRTFSHA